MVAIEIGLVGNPNCGKTTLFNALTGSRQRVGNWPGVTVERKMGVSHFGDDKIKVTDLPGAYSLMVASDDLSQDERIACDYIQARKADVIVNIIDASNIERNLYLTLQLLEMGVPVVVALNMMDVVRKKGLKINVEQLQKHLGCPVVTLESNRRKGIHRLKEAVVKVAQNKSQPSIPFCYSSLTEQAINAIIDTMSSEKNRLLMRSGAVRLLEGDVLVAQKASDQTLAKVKHWQQKISQANNEALDVIIADARYAFITDLVSHCVCKKTIRKHRVTAILDNVVLNRFLGIPIFLGVMYLMFLFAINIGGAFQDFFDLGSDVLFVQTPAYLLAQIHAPAWFIALVAQGVGKGINTVVTFIPVIGGMFLFLSFLEYSGYMVRAAFVVDRLMRAIGLPGKSFVPMIVGFGCNVPSVLATRTLENKRDRILTVLMSPFMSCGARLAIFAVFTAAFFPQGGQNVVFALYLIGIFVAIVTGLILRKTILKGEPAPFVLELPMYHMPSFKNLMMHTWHRLRGFVIKAGRLIIPICILLGFLNAFTLSGGLAVDGSTNSLLAWFGRLLTPIFSPMGIHQNNWPATVGLLSGVLAKEVVVGTLNSLYSQAGHIALQVSDFHFWGGLKAAFMTIPQNFSQLATTMLNPIAASAPDSTMANTVMGQMYSRFAGQIGAFAYLLFVLLYFPCVSTTAAMSRELGKGWAWFSVAWTTGVAYGTAVSYFQLATFSDHPVASTLWVSAIVLSFLGVLFAMKLFAKDEKAGPAGGGICHAYRKTGVVS